MAFANHFYHRLTRKYVAVFGSLFNKITIKRYDKDGVEIQSMPVPLSYGPWQKFLARIQSDPELNRRYATLLPRMSFEIDSIAYDQERRSSQLNKLTLTDANGKNFVYNPTPYTLNFSLNIIVAHIEDGTQIVEQIIPFFQPGFVSQVHLLEGLDAPVDISVDLVSVSSEDAYDGQYEEVRMIRWTLNFTMRGFYFGPTKTKKVIKFIDVKMKIRERRDFEDKEYLGSLITLQPGLDADGNPTTDIDETILYEEINIDDNWEMLTQIHGFDELLALDLVDKDPNPNETNGKL